MSKDKLQAVDPNNLAAKPEVPDPNNLTAKPEIPDPFDLEKLRLNPSFVEKAGVKKLRTTVPARKPNPQEFVRVHPDPAYRANFAMIELKEDREDYLVLPHVVPQLPGEIIFKTIFTAINRQNGLHPVWMTPA